MLKRRNRREPDPHTEVFIPEEWPLLRLRREGDGAGWGPRKVYSRTPPKSFLTSVGEFLRRLTGRTRDAL